MGALKDHAQLRHEQRACLPQCPYHPNDPLPFPDDTEAP